MPTNLHGPGDNYRTGNSHLIQVLIRRFHEAKVTNNPAVTIWGGVNPKSEFLFLDDMVAASLFVMNLSKFKLCVHVQQMIRHINVRFGEDITSKRWQRQWARPSGIRV
jgi:GDP-L-fucose synthase